LANLAWLGIASAMHQSKNFADVLGLVLKLLFDSEQFASTPLGKAKRNGQRRRGRRKQSKHDPRRRDPTEVSEEAFAKARGKMPLSYWMALLLLLGKRFQAEHGQTVRWNGFRLLAMDGTCLKLPKWKRLADYFGTASNGKGTRSPQARMVMLQFPLARIPYRYELTPTKVSEKTSAVRLAKHLAADDLVLLDRGFWSYGLFWEIHNQAAWFAAKPDSPEPCLRSCRARIVLPVGSLDDGGSGDPTRRRPFAAEFHRGVAGTERPVREVADLQPPTRCSDPPATPSRPDCFASGSYTFWPSLLPTSRHQSEKLRLRKSPPTQQAPSKPNPKALQQKDFQKQTVERLVPLGGAHPT
jgi:hypothetical protein